MKKYNTDDITVQIRILDDPKLKHLKILNIQFGKYEDIGREDEVEIIVPKFLIKSNFSNAGMAKHILNYFIKG